MLDSAGGSGAEVSMTILALKTVGALLLVIGLMLVSLYLLRRFGRFSPARFTQKEHLALVSQTYVGPKKNICVFQIRNKLLVVGVSESSLTLLTEIDIDDHNDAHFEQVLEEEESASSVTQHLADTDFGRNS